MKPYLAIRSLAVASHLGPIGKLMSARQPFMQFTPIDSLHLLAADLGYGSV
jgi:hypothetical protein